MRLDVFDVLVGINLLREGLDIPEITLVAAYMMTWPSALRAARPMVWIKEVALLRNPSLSAF